MTRPAYQPGFSAVELLITLFIAAAFLMTGYQLYSAIIRDSGEARQHARASTLAYDYLRRYAAQVPVTCTNVPLWLDRSPVTVEGLVNVYVSVARSCPQPSLTDLSKVQVTVRYGDTAKEVTHAIYARP